MKVEPFIPTPEMMAKVEEVSRRCRVDEEVVKAYLLRIPPTWNAIGGMHGGGGGAFGRNGIQVLASLQKYQDGNVWIHVSACRRTGVKDFELPTYEDLARVKHDFIGKDNWAYQVFAAESEHVNHHPCVLHLWARLDGKPALPDFTSGIGMI